MITMYILTSLILLLIIALMTAIAKKSMIDIEIYGILIKHVDALIDKSVSIYFTNNGLYDILIENTTITKSEYEQHILEATKFVYDRLPVIIHKFSLVYIGKKKLLNFIIDSIDEKVSSIYKLSFSDDDRDVDED